MTAFLKGCRFDFVVVDLLFLDPLVKFLLVLCPPGNPAVFYTS